MPPRSGARCSSTSATMTGSCIDPHSDSVFGQSETVLVGPRFALQLLEEALVVPDFEIIDPAEHADVADDGRAVAQMWWNDDAPLAVEFGGLAVVIHAVEKLQARGMIGGHLEQLPLDLEPRGKRIDAHALPRQARDKHVRPVRVLNDPTKDRG